MNKGTYVNGLIRLTLIPSFIPYELQYNLNGSTIRLNSRLTLYSPIVLEIGLFDK